MLIATYPEFSKLNINHKLILDNYAKKYGHYSDFNFISVFSWDTKNDTEISELNGNLVIKMPDYITGKGIYSLIGSSDIDRSLDALLAKTDVLKLVPEVVINNIKYPDNFNITEDQDNHDYVFNVKDLVDLCGLKYKDIRNKINKFKREYPGFEKFDITATSVLDIDKFKSFHDVFYRWSRDKDLSEKEFELEKTAIYRLVEYSKEFNLLIVEIRHKGELLAFSFNEIVEPGYAITHFEKAIKIHQHFNSFVVHEVSSFLAEFGCKKVNWEQDLGLPGLRRSKSDYCPSEMLNKYKITNSIFE